MLLFTIYNENNKRDFRYFTLPISLMQCREEAKSM